MKCYDCNIEVEPQFYPEGECPACGLTYTLGDEHWEMCDECGEPPGTIHGKCLDCHLEQQS